VLKRLQVIAKGLRKHDIEVTCAAEWDYPRRGDRAPRAAHGAPT
jgi:hypothetical protein